MAYLEKIKNESGKTFYYLTKSVRLSGNKFKKIRVSFHKKPSKAEIEKALKEIEKEYGKLTEEFQFLTSHQLEILDELKDAYSDYVDKLPPTVQDKFEQDFYIRFTYNTNAIEGNRLSLNQTAMILKDKQIPTGIETKDYNEAINGRDALNYIKQYKEKLSFELVEKINEELTKNTGVMYSGRIRFFPVMITNSDHIPPEADDVKPMLEKAFKEYYSNKRKKIHPVINAYLLHAQIAHIHPFEDGNGRTSRALMNWSLIMDKYPRFYIPFEKRGEYYKALEKYDKGELKEYCQDMFDLTIGQYKQLSTKKGKKK